MTCTASLLSINIPAVENSLIDTFPSALYSLSSYFLNLYPLEGSANTVWLRDKANLQDITPTNTILTFLLSYSWPLLTDLFVSKLLVCTVTIRSICSMFTSTQKCLTVFFCFKCQRTKGRSFILKKSVEYGVIISSN